MAVSYVSQVYESNPYVIPVDLNLLASVNQYKQTEFYKNAAKVENQIVQLNNSDIANPEQQQKLKGLVGNLTKQIDGMGAINYSDLNVTNTLQGYSRSILDDEDVMQGIIGTKKVRQLQNNIEQLKTNPKLSKYYSVANEWDAMLKVNEYVTGGLKARYTGDTSPSPYKGNVATRLLEAVRKINPNIEVRFGDSGNPFFIEKGTYKTVDPATVYAAINATIDGDLLGQIDIDARYNMRGYGADDVLEVARNDYKNRKEQLLSQQKYYNNILASEPNTLTKIEMQKGLDETTQTLRQLGDAFDENINGKLASTPQGLNVLKSKVYMNQLFNDMVKVGSYTQHTGDLITNQQEIWNKKLAIEQLKTQYRATTKGKTTTNNATGIDEASTGFTDYGSNMQTDEEVTKTLKTMADFQAISTDYRKQNQIDTRSFIENLAKSQPEYADLLKFTTQVSGNANARRVESKSNVLDKIAMLDNDATGVSREDIKYATADPSLTKQQREFFGNLFNNFNSAAEGKLNEIDFAGMKIDKKEFLNLVDNYQDREMAASVNDRIINDVSRNNVNKITDAKDKQLYEEYLKTPSSDRWGFANVNTRYRVDTKDGDRIKAIQNKYNVSSKEVDKELNKGIYRENYLDFNLKNRKDLLDNGIDLQTRITGANNHPKDIGDPDKISAQRVRRLPGKEDIWTMQYYYEDDKKNGKYSTSEQDIRLNEADLNLLGIKPLPKPDLENYMRYNDVSRPYFNYNETMGVNGLFKYEIVNLQKGLNNPTFLIRFKNGNSTVPIKIGYAGQPFKSANEAYAFGQAITNSTTLDKIKASFGLTKPEEIRTKFFNILAENAWGKVN